MAEKIIRIGGASAGWGDSIEGPRQLIRRAEIDYLSFDYLAEMTMSILAGARAKDPTAGWAIDFVTRTLDEIIVDAVKKRVKILSNAGGLNPRGCAAAIEALARKHELTVRVAVVEGDDVSTLIKSDPRSFSSRDGKAPPNAFLSANAYLGAFPIAAALDDGADIVITGRCVDSALPLAALIHEFGWKPDEFDKLAAGSLAGHLLECGAQATGGLHTDWRRVPRWEDIGYPIAECDESGAFVISKPAGTGGLVEPLVVAEQLLYEIGDPSAYVLPDVICNFAQARLVQDGPDRVRVSGATGRAPPNHYKVSVTYDDGWRVVASLVLIGPDAAEKAQRTADALLARSRRQMRFENLPDFANVHFEALGAEWTYGPQSRAINTREVSMRLVVDHTNRRALEILAGEVAAAVVSWAPGTTGFGARPTPRPIVRLFSCSVPKADVEITIHAEGRDVAAPAPAFFDCDRTTAPPPSYAATCERTNLETIEVPLRTIACARSGDKGDIANIGVIARTPALWPILAKGLTEERVADYFRHYLNGKVTRYEAPGIHALNFVLEGALAGGGMASPRIDPLAKAFAQMLLDISIAVPEHLAMDV